MGITIADITIPAEDFELGPLVADYPETYVELDRVVPLDRPVVPYIWVSGGSSVTIEEVPEIHTIEKLTESDDQTLYRLEWSEDVDGVIGTLVQSDGTLLEGVGSAKQWEFHIRFPDQSAFGEFTRRCSEKGIGVNLRSVYSPDAPGQEPRSLTHPQREALTTAYEGGFFEVPREITLSDLAADLDISEQAVSQRLRRGTGNLVATMLLDTDE